MSLVGQAVFLSAVLGEDAIWLEGEMTDPTGKIRLIGPSALHNSTDRFDVILNIDSFTEMPLEQSVAYFQFAAEHCKTMYSMNHELNPYRTIDISEKAGIAIPGIRHASAFRKGYVEELYFFETVISSKNNQSQK